MNATSGTSYNSSSSSEARELVGWVSESTGRGTLSLIVTCAFTIFLCTWVVIHPRIHKHRLVGWLHKFALFLKAVVAPEFIAVEGLQEWSQARRMVKNCAEVTVGRLKLVHAFYIGMLGLRYRTPRGERVLWPNQYTWLLEERLIDWENHAAWGLGEKNIRDKSNADGTTKLAALWQVTWFVAQSIIRTAHQLPLSALESMTLSYIPLFVVTYFFWWVKPKDILTPSVVDLPYMLPEQRAIFEAMAVSSTFDDEGIGQRDSLWIIWQLTPRVFEKEEKDKALRRQQEKGLRRAEPLWKYSGRGNDTSSGEDSNNSCDDPTAKRHPEGILVAQWDPELYHSKIWPAICLFGTSFPALHLISWYTVFPSLIEQWLWRGSAIVSIVCMLVFMHFEKVFLRWGGPMTMLSILSPALYLISRIIMMGGAIAAFRGSEPAIYDTYAVANYWIHLL